jgi:hypothetical protein
MQWQDLSRKEGNFYVNWLITTLKETSYDGINLTVTNASSSYLA